MAANWNTISLSTDDMELVLLTGVGGRLWDIVFRGERLLFRNPDLEGVQFKVEDVAQLPTRSPHFGFPLWGGEKTWVAPDSKWPKGAPHSVLDSGAYTVELSTATEVLMVSARCPLSGLRISRRITLRSKQSFDIMHTVSNEGENIRETGIWSVMMLNHPSTIAIPSSCPDFAPVFGEAGDLVGKNALASICTCNRKVEFKVGVHCDTGVAIMQIGAKPVWLLCETKPTSVDEVFLHGQPCEVFNSGDYDYCEAEWHSPAKSLAPGETMSFSQQFELWQNKDRPPGITKQQIIGEVLACM